jgi:type II secretory pathway pseudopilin PulG
MLKPINSPSNTIWIAIIAVLFAALLPGLSQALDRGTKHSQILAICTSTGMKYVQVSKNIQGDETTETSQYSTECSLCQITQHLVGLIGCPSKQSCTSIATFALPIPPHNKASKTLQWSLPQSRAPPVTHS